MTNSTYNPHECLRCTHCAHLLVQSETLRSRQAIVNQKIRSTFTIALAVEACEITARRREAREAWMRHWAVHRIGAQVQGRSK